ncbi:phosphatidate cytidylyltransferase [Mycoplasmopsis hyopharyngis]|uniref:phosphatidate cytidylyltransferase n=1 Tax=Mycoplasmopsis hyopharyngis TaxID=29558 RepID=UPI003872D05A
MKLFKERILPGLLFTFFFVGLIIPTSIFGQKNNNIGLTFRIIFFIISSFLLFCAVYELFSAFGIKKYISIILGILFATTMFAPFEEFLDFITLRKIVSNVNLASPNYLLKTYLRQMILDYQSVIFVLGFALFFLFYEMKNNYYNTKADKLLRFLFILITLYLLSIAIKAFLYFVFFSYNYWILAIFASAICDIMAYVFGMTMGRKIIKVGFAPKISPKKSWEGVFGGFTLTAIFILIFSFTMPLFNKNVVYILIATIFIPVVSILGDLYFSLLKRINYIKDYSQILKGHGGILDRLDSHTFVFFLLTFLCVYAL